MYVAANVQERRILFKKSECPLIGGVRFKINAVVDETLPRQRGSGPDKCFRFRHAVNAQHAFVDMRFAPVTVFAGQRQRSFTGFFKSTDTGQS